MATPKIFIIFVIATLVFAAPVYAAYGDEDTTNWNKSYDKNGNPGTAYAIATDSNNNVYVCGYQTDEIGASSNPDILMRKYYPNGTLHWSYSKNGGGTSASDYCWGVAVDSANDIYFAGYAKNQVSGSSGLDWYIRKYNASGGELFNRAVHSSGSDRAYDIAVDSSRNFIAVGSRANSQNWMIIAYDSSNNQLWSKIYAVSGEARAVAVDSNDNVYVGGYGNNIVSGSSGKDWIIKKFNSTGAEDATNWNKSFTSSGANDDRVLSIAIDSNDNVYVGGYGVNIVGGGTTGYDWWIKKFTSAGVEDKTNWNKTFTGPNGYLDWLNDLYVDSIGNLYVVGRTDTPNSNDKAMWIKKFTSAGVEDTTSWNKTIKSPIGSDDAIAETVTIDSNNNVFVAGSGTNIATQTTGLDWWIKKFQGVSGTPPTKRSNHDELYIGSSTDLNQIGDYNSVSGLVLQYKDGGKVEWNAAVNLSGANIATGFTLKPNAANVYYASGDHPLNESANITFNDVNCDKFNLYYSSSNDPNAILWPYQTIKDTGSVLATQADIGGDCSDASVCTSIGCANNVLTFTTQHFTGFAADGNANLTINDSAEGSSEIKNTPVDFFAYYINATSGAHISGASCNVSFDDGTGPFNMVEDTGSTPNKYNYTKSSGFATLGIHNWNVTCDATGFTTLEANDTIVIFSGGGTAPEFSDYSLLIAIILSLGGFLMIRKKKISIYE